MRWRLRVDEDKSETELGGSKYYFISWWSFSTSTGTSQEWKAVWCVQQSQMQRSGRIKRLGDLFPSTSVYWASLLPRDWRQTSFGKRVSRRSARAATQTGRAPPMSGGACVLASLTEWWIRKVAPLEMSQTPSWYLKCLHLSLLDRGCGDVAERLGGKDSGHWHVTSARG